MPVIFGAVKLLAVVFGSLLALTGAADVVGGSPHQTLNTLLNFAAVGASALAAQWIRDLRSRTDSGETPAATNTSELREAVVELREIALSIREGLGKAGVIEQRATPRTGTIDRAPGIWPQDPGGRA